MTKPGRKSSAKSTQSAKPSSRRSSKKQPEGWPFLDPPNFATISLRRIMFGDAPILMVCHDDDGSWQFLDGEDITEADACVIGLEEAIAHDPTLTQVATLPRGWYASRAAPGKPWWVAPSGVTIKDAYGLDKT